MRVKIVISSNSVETELWAVDVEDNCDMCMNRAPSGTILVNPDGADERRLELARFECGDCFMGQLANGEFVIVRTEVLS